MLTSYIKFLTKRNYVCFYSQTQNNHSQPCQRIQYINRC